MNKILLIRRPDAEDYTEEKKRVFFSIGGMNISAIENKIIDLLKKSGLIESDDLLLKYNGVELNISTQDIPKVIKLFSKEDVKIYSVFQLYNPE